MLKYNHIIIFVHILIKNAMFSYTVNIQLEEGEFYEPNTIPNCYKLVMCS